MSRGRARTFSDLVGKPEMLRVAGFPLLPLSKGARAIAGSSITQRAAALIHAILLRPREDRPYRGVGTREIVSRLWGRTGRAPALCRDCRRWKRWREVGQPPARVWILVWRPCMRHPGYTGESVAGLQPMIAVPRRRLKIDVGTPPCPFSFTKSRCRMCPRSADRR